MNDQQTEQANEPLPSSEPMAEAPAGESAVADAPAVVAEPVAPPKEDWRDKRIGQLTAQKKALEAKAQALEIQLLQRPGETDANFEARVEAAAEAKAIEKTQANKFIDECNREAAAGRKAFSDFDDRINNLSKLVDKSDPVRISSYQQLVSAALETGEGAKLLHSLGADLDEASRIMSLSPVKQGIELARIAARQAAPVSSAPRPIRPIGNRGESLNQVDPADKDRGDSLDTRSWMERREQQIAEAQKRRFSR